METVLLLAILVILGILLSKFNSNNEEIKKDFRNLNSKIDELKSELKKSKSLSELKDDSTKIDAKISETFVPNSETSIVEKPIEKEKEKPEISVVEESTQKDKQRVAFSNINKPSVEISKKQEPKIILPPQKSWLEKFRENNPDIEKFIGENLINKIGILILVLGISFFVKYAIDKNWISEPLRVAIGILSGSIVMGVAHKLKKNYKAFSSVFVAGAISIYYLTIAIAFHDYHLFSQTVAFIIMCIITAFSVFVSVSYDRKELAVLSLIGGFAVPFMVSTGEGNYKVLFTYIAILNIGMLAIAYFKKWNLVTILAFAFTCILYASWFYTDFYSNHFHFRGALFFATIFYLIFSFASVAGNLRNGGQLSVEEYFIITINTFFYFGFGISVLNIWNPDFRGLFTIALALYNLLYAMFLYRKFGIDKNAIYLLLGLTLTFVTIAIPIQFRGNYITLFWAAEAVVLFWLAQKSKIDGFKLGAIIVQILMFISLIMDWNQKYLISEKTLPIVFNPIFITGLVAIASLVATYFILKKEKEIQEIFNFSFNPIIYSKIIQILAVLLSYFVGIFEVNYQSNQWIENTVSAQSFSVLFHYVFSTILIIILLKKYSNSKLIALFLAGVNIVVYVLLFYKLPSNEIVENISRTIHNQFAFYFHYIVFACVIYYIVLIAQEILSKSEIKILQSKYAVWILAFCGVYILSNELIVHGLYINRDSISTAEILKNFGVKNLKQLSEYDISYFAEDKLREIKIQIIKIGYPILWGVISFALLILGIKKNWKQIRIIALSLLGITIIKLFAYDINNASETGKIIAFILLGVLILIISFVYQKIKKLVVDEPKKIENEENS